MYISKTTKQIFVLAIALIVEAIIILTCHHVSPPQEGSQQVDTLEWVSDAGDVVSSLKGTPEAFAVVDHKEADSIAKVYRVKIKNLQEYIVALEHTNSDLLADVDSKQTDYFPVDTTKDCPPQAKNLRQTFTNPYYVAKAQLGDSPYLHLEHFDTLTAVWKKVKEGSLFNRKTFLQLDLSMASHKSDSANNRFYGLKAYRKATPVKQWSIGFVAGYGVYLKGAPQFGPFAGVGLSKTIARF